MTSLTVNGLEISYTSEGEGEPILLIPGFGADNTIWEPLAVPLSAKYQMISCNPCSFYTLEAEEEATWLDPAVEFLHQFIDELRLESLVVIGHSSGAAIAAALAHKYPNKLNKLVLINPFKKLGEVPHFAFSSIERLMREKVKKEHLTELMIPWLFSKIFFANTEQVKNFIEYSSQHYMFGSVEKCGKILEAISLIDISSLLSKIQSPALLLAGENDLIVSQNESNSIADTIPNCELIQVPNAGHMIHWEQPDLCVKLIEKFLGS